MSEQGFSFVETIFAVVILFFLTSTLIPMTFYMKQQIVTQKLQMHAAEVAFNGAIKYQRYGKIAGVQQIDGTYFNWSYSENSLCVIYNNGTKMDEYCV